MSENTGPSWKRDLVLYRFVPLILALISLSSSFAGDTTTPQPCHFDKPIHVEELTRAVKAGCYLPTGTVITVRVTDVYPGDPRYEPDPKPNEPTPPSDLSANEVDQLNGTIGWLIAHPKVARVRVEVYLPDLELTWQQAEAKATARAESVVDYMLAKGVAPERIEHKGVGVSSDGTAHIDFVVLEVRKD